MAATQPTTNPSTGGRLVSNDGRALPLTSTHLSATAGGGIARVVLTQRFKNPYAEPLEVRYLLPLPSDGAVSGFAFTLGDTRVIGEVTGKQQARERFERALVRGQTAALLEQDRTSLFTQRVGNIPPHCEIVAEVTVDQPLRWLAEGQWEWRFPTVVAPRYQGQPGRVADAPKLNVPVADGDVGARASLALSIVDRLTGAVESTSHRVTEEGSEPVAVRIVGPGAVRLDRDVVVRWPVALPEVSANVIAARPATAAHDGDAFALLTVAPPTGGGVAVPRDLTFLIDTSGSMGGRPLDQAAQVVSRMIQTLGVNDRIEMIEFGTRPRRWKEAPVRATASAKQDAIAWVRALHASGATEMHRAVLEALRPLRDDAQRQVVLVTDGYIGFEREIVHTLLTKLPAGARLHTVGVGDSVNRSLTQAAARAGRGTELIVGIDEDPGRLVQRLLARTTAPLVTDLRLEGSALVEVAPASLPDLYAEAPALIAARLRNQGGELVLRGHTAEGPFEQRFLVERQAAGQGPAGVAALFGREKVEDLETRLSAGGNPTELNASIEATGIEFQIATRLTSWIAVSEEVTVETQDPARVVEQPHELPHGVSAEGLGLRAPQAGMKIGPYTVKQTLGEGAMGSVYLAEVDEEAVPRLAARAPAPPRASRQRFAAPPPAASAPGAPMEKAKDKSASGAFRLPPGGAVPPLPPEELDIEFEDVDDAISREGGETFSISAQSESFELMDAVDEPMRDAPLGGGEGLTRTGAYIPYPDEEAESRLTRAGRASHDVGFGRPAKQTAVKERKLPLLLLLIAIALLALVIWLVVGALSGPKAPSAQGEGSRPGVGGRR